MELFYPLQVRINERGFLRILMKLCRNSRYI